jgi:hypothetical protein
MATVFRPYDPSSSHRSDRTATDRLRHRQKVRDAIRGNLAEIVAEESIIGGNRDQIIKVPIRGIKEYRFIFGDNAPGVAGGGDQVEPGQAVGKGEKAPAIPRASDDPGVDYYETEVTLEELIDLLFEDLELPLMERKQLKELDSEDNYRRKGYRKKGVRVRLDKRRTAIARVKRKQASRGVERALHLERFPFHNEDLIYRHTATETRRESNAVVLCIMDTSGSMDTIKKYLARSFFFLLYRFLCTRYRRVEVVFIAHHTEAHEVTEEEFFHKGESGGTHISSGYLKALEIIDQRYHPSLWNIYAFHCSDGDNFESDNAPALAAARQLAEVANLLGYGEIKPLGSGYYGSSMVPFLSQLETDNFQTVQIQRKEDIWPAFRSLLARDRGRVATQEQ